MLSSSTSPSKKSTFQFQPTRSSVIPSPCLFVHSSSPRGQLLAFLSFCKAQKRRNSFSYISLCRVPQQVDLRPGGVVTRKLVSSLLYNAAEQATSYPTLTSAGRLLASIIEALLILQREGLHQPRSRTSFSRSDKPGPSGRPQRETNSKPSCESKSSLQNIGVAAVLNKDLIRGALGVTTSTSIKTREKISSRQDCLSSPSSLPVSSLS